LSRIGQTEKFVEMVISEKEKRKKKKEKEFD
jgi:hypothetical protein